VKRIGITSSNNNCIVDDEEKIVKLIYIITWNGEKKVIKEERM
jgi:hypothetical protein